MTKFHYTNEDGQDLYIHFIHVEFRKPNPNSIHDRLITSDYRFWKLSFPKSVVFCIYVFSRSLFMVIKLLCRKFQNKDILNFCFRFWVELIQLYFHTENEASSFLSFADQRSINIADSAMYYNNLQLGFLC